jgi:hypothetical protein
MAVQCRFLRSPENHENPFIADGELRRKADYILRYSTISRRRIRIADPDCIPLQSSSGAEDCSDIGLAGNIAIDDDDLRWRQPSAGNDLEASDAYEDVAVSSSTLTALTPHQRNVDDQFCGDDGRVCLLNGSPPASSSAAANGRRPVIRINGRQDFPDGANGDEDDTTGDGRLELASVDSRPTAALLVNDRAGGNGDDDVGAGCLSGSSAVDGPLGSSERPSSAGRLRRRRCCMVQ